MARRTSKSTKVASPSGRQTVGRKKARAGDSKPTKQAAANAQTPAKTPLSKSDFIRSLPLSMPLRELLAKAESMGLTMSRPLVHAVRAEMRHASGAGSLGPRKAGRGSRGKSAVVAKRDAPNAELEKNLRHAAAAFIVAKGSERAMAVIADVSARIIAAARG